MHLLKDGAKPTLYAKLSSSSLPANSSSAPFLIFLSCEFVLGQKICSNESVGARRKQAVTATDLEQPHWSFLDDLEELAQDVLDELLEVRRRRIL